MRFEREIVVRFEHCDPAGIMFYPRFFALVNEVVEDWFAAMDHPFATLHLRDRRAVPTVKMDAEFARPARLGERLRQSLRVADIGRSSCRLEHNAYVGEAFVARFEQVLVLINVDTMKASEWPLDLRAMMTRYEDQV